MEEKSSGVSPNPPTENESILGDILEIMDSTPIRNPVIVLKNEEKKRKEALATREIAMNTWKKAENVVKMKMKKIVTLKTRKSKSLGLQKREKEEIVQTNSIFGSENSK